MEPCCHKKEESGKKCNGSQLAEVLSLGAFVTLVIIHQSFFEKTPINYIEEILWKCYFYLEMYQCKNKNAP